MSSPSDNKSRSVATLASWTASSLCSAFLFANLRHNSEICECHQSCTSTIFHLRVLEWRSKIKCLFHSTFPYMERMVTQTISTQSTHRRRCSTGTNPYVTKCANGHNFQPACTHPENRKIRILGTAAQEGEKKKNWIN
jgi:hypothetical protein